ncbi:BTB/POZ domain-containing protein 19 [Pichia californica]|nr:BTB/POZ domain-containing protein 19 [[Candida] californica]
MPYLQSFGPQYPLQYIPSYYPMQINQQTGSLNTLPISAPPYPISTQPLQYQNQLQQQQQQQQQQQVMFVQPRPQQIVYARTANGQLIPLLVQQPQSFNNLGMVVPSQVHNNDTITNNDVTVKNDDTPNKRQKTAKLTENELIQNAENLQRQHILRQMQMHPNLNKELQIPNISDVFHTNCNSETSATSTSGNENIETEEVIDNELEIKAENDHDQVENIKSINYSLISNNLEKSSDKNTQSPPSLQKKPQKIIGTVTLGTFTYQYSQTLSGDLTRDKELFDRLSDNAWKTCISKR